jgi:hypothetical protein
MLRFCVFHAALSDLAATFPESYFSLLDYCTRCGLDGPSVVLAAALLRRFVC